MGSNQISNFSKFTCTPAEKEEPIFELFVSKQLLKSPA